MVDIGVINIITIPLIEFFGNGNRQQGYLLIAILYGCIFVALSQFFFSGFNTAIYAIIPDCVEYGEWKSGIRNDGFQYAFISLGNKVGMALGSSLLALVLGMKGYVSNAVQNEEVISVMRHAFSTIPGVLWILTAGVLLFYRLNKTEYNRIVGILKDCALDKTINNIRIWKAR